MFSKILKGTSREVKSKVYLAYVRPNLKYCSVCVCVCVVWDKHQQRLDRKIDMVHRRTARFVFGKFDRFSNVTLMISELGWSNLLERNGLS